MKVTKKLLESIIKSYLFESKERIYNLTFGESTLSFKKDSEGNIFVLSWVKETYKGQKISKDSPKPLSFFKSVKDPNGEKFVDIVKREIDLKDSKDPNVRKYKYEQGSSFPVILINNNAPVISDKFIGLIDKDKQQEIKDAIPEGHVSLVCINPRSRKAVDIDFGVYDETEGGHADCNKQNQNIFKNILKVAGVGGMIHAIGSVRISYGTLEARLTKNEKSYTFKDDSAIKEYLKDLGYDENSDYTVINDCQHTSKVIAWAKTNNCYKYALIPDSVIGSVFSYFQDIADTYTGSDITVKGKGSENCATMGYKLAYMAKNGSMPQNVDKGLFKYPPNAVEQAKNI